jgi:hypothetical protein
LKNKKLGWERVVTRDGSSPLLVYLLLGLGLVILLHFIRLWMLFGNRFSHLLGR